MSLKLSHSLAKVFLIVCGAVAAVQAQQTGNCSAIGYTLCSSKTQPTCCDAYDSVGNPIPYCCDRGQKCAASASDRCITESNSAFVLESTVIILIILGGIVVAVVFAACVYKCCVGEKTKTKQSAYTNNADGQAMYGVAAMPSNTPPGEVAQQQHNQESAALSPSPSGTTFNNLDEAVEEPEPTLQTQAASVPPRPAPSHADVLTYQASDLRRSTSSAPQTQIADHAVPIPVRGRDGLHSQHSVRELEE